MQITTCCDPCGGFPINWEMMSIGIGKMMVLLFSAEMLFSVCRYRSWKYNYDDHDDHDDDDRDEDEEERRKEMSSRFYNLILHLRLAAMHSFNSPLALSPMEFHKNQNVIFNPKTASGGISQKPKFHFQPQNCHQWNFTKTKISFSTKKLTPMELHKNKNVIFNLKTATNGNGLSPKPKCHFQPENCLQWNFMKTKMSF